MHAWRPSLSLTPLCQEVELLFCCELLITIRSKNLYVIIGLLLKLHRRSCSRPTKVAICILHYCKIDKLAKLSILVFRFGYLLTCFCRLVLIWDKKKKFN